MTRGSPTVHEDWLLRPRITLAQRVVMHGQPPGSALDWMDPRLHARPIGDCGPMVSINRTIRSLKRAVALVALAGVPALAQNSSAVLPVSPPGSIQPTGTWGLA